MSDHATTTAQTTPRSCVPPRRRRVHERAHGERRERRRVRRGSRRDARASRRGRPGSRDDRPVSTASVARVLRASRSSSPVARARPGRPRRCARRACCTTVSAAAATLGVVGHEQDRLAAGVQPAQQLDDLLAARRVERAGRLVGEQQRRLVGERAGDREALALAAGEHARHRRGLVADARAGRAGRARASRRPCDAARR